MTHGLQRTAPFRSWRSVLLPAVRFSQNQLKVLITLSLLMGVTSFGASLLSQNLDFVAHSFGASDRVLGGALAASRLGVVVALLATALADHHGRRPLLLLSFTGLCVANAVSALAPNLFVFTAAQLLTRGFAMTAMTLAPLAALEEAPEGARAYSMAVTGVAGVAGYGLGLVLLPLSDVSLETWRLSFALSAASVALVPFFVRHLHETGRYSGVAVTSGKRGRLGQVVGRASGERFLLLMVFVFILAAFTAPVSQFSNRYLAEQRGFSGFDITVFRVVTQAVPGLVGLMVGARLAEIRGRRPVIMVAAFGGTLAEMVFLLSHGPTLWLSSAVGVLIGGIAAPAITAFTGELFPTEIRGTANALQLVAGVAGAAIGLLVAGSLSSRLGLGPAVALLGAPSLVAALLLIPRLPESAARPLEAVSPSEFNEVNAIRNR